MTPYRGSSVTPPEPGSCLVGSCLVGSCLVGSCLVGSCRGHQHGPGRGVVGSCVVGSCIVVPGLGAVFLESSGSTGSIILGGVFSLGGLVSLGGLALSLPEPLSSLGLLSLLPSGLLLLPLLGSSLDDGVLDDASGFEVSGAAGCRSCTAGSTSGTADFRSGTADCTSSTAGCRSCATAFGSHCAAAGSWEFFESSGSGTLKRALELKPSVSRAATTAISHCHSGSLAS